MATTATDTIMAEAATIPQITQKPDRLPITVEKPTPYTYDLAHLTAVDPNPLSPTSTLLSESPSERNATLQAIARDGAQSLLNSLLSTCPITSTPDGLIMTLPPSLNPLPRWKPLPKPKPPTKWEQFARKKGIGKFGGSAKGGAVLEERKKNMVYDEEKGEWVKKWGYKGKNKNGESDWLVELDEKKLRKEKDGQEEGKTVRGEGRRERVERMKRQERKQRNNERRTRKGTGG